MADKRQILNGLAIISPVDVHLIIVTILGHVEKVASERKPTD